MVTKTLGEKKRNGLTKKHPEKKKWINMVAPVGEIKTEIKT